ncbi:MAG: DUF2975 domain-containing protein [Cohaesibacteraceae bacterium]|nr:DUF2975 domain-containing protein [Cohaesibacteraceae bacterium]MBL4876868.1 DUF2975 domain-containing protein [Cohaesibacteraceae bacterium]
MEQTLPDRMKRIRNFSTVIVWVITLIVLISGFLVLLLNLFFLAPDFLGPDLLAELEPDLRELSFDLEGEKGLSISLIDLSQMQRTLFVAMIDGLTVFLFCTLWTLRRVFVEYSKGDLFSIVSFRMITNFGWMVLVLTIAEIVSTTLQSMILTWNLPAGQRQMELDISYDDILSIVIACVFIVIGWILAEAARINAENETFI